MFTTEVWLTPLILLPGVALLTVSTAHRLGQLQSDLHRLLDRPDSHAPAVARSLIHRAHLYRNSLASLYFAVVLFAVGSLLGGVVNLWRPESLWIVGGLTIVGIAAIVYSALQLFRESLIALEVIEEQFAALQESLHERAQGERKNRPTH